MPLRKEQSAETKRIKRTESYSTIELTSSIHQVKVRFTIVRLSSLVNIGLSKEKEVGARFVPLHLNLVGFVESFRARRSGESEEGVNFDRSGCTL